MSMPLRYAFYRVTKNGELADPNEVGSENTNEVEIEKIAECYSDRFTMFGPPNDDGIRHEAFLALEKLTRFVEKEEIDSEEARRVNAVVIESTIVSFQEVAVQIYAESEEFKIASQEELARIETHLPLFLEFKPKQ